MGSLGPGLSGPDGDDVVPAPKLWAHTYTSISPLVSIGKSTSATRVLASRLRVRPLGPAAPSLTKWMAPSPTPTAIRAWSTSRDRGRLLLRGPGGFGAEVVVVVEVAGSGGAGDGGVSMLVRASRRCP